MTAVSKRIPLQVDVRRIIEVLATQIYQSPLALLRENTQNAFDAILLRIHRGDEFDPRIAVEIRPTEIRIDDNGIGMTYTEVSGNYWKAGASSKNTPEAKAAGVVGTFGIGAMANFGIASRLEVVTESAVNGERTLTRANAATLSVRDDCIELLPQLALASPGTSVLATISNTTRLDLTEAVSYIAEFVRHVAIPITVNGRLVSQQPLDSQWPRPTSTWSATDRLHLTADIIGTVTADASRDGQLWLDVSELQQNGEDINGRAVIAQGVGAFQTLRSGFGLATVAANSVYGFGGTIDLPMLQPTAGREALSTSSMQLIQEIVQRIEDWVSPRLAEDPIADKNVQFIEWARRNRRPELCGFLTLRVAPSDRKVTLIDVREQTRQEEMSFYSGTDTETIRALASEDNELLIGSQRNPRRECEQIYLNSYCRVAAVAEGPRLVEAYSRGTRRTAELAVAHRVADTLERDYFLRSEVILGKISHRVPVFVVSADPAVRIALDPDGPSFKVLTELYESEYSAFGSFSKDFVRSVVFPQVESLVPSSTREGAAAFLTRIRSKRDLFEYDLADKVELSAIWEDYYRGNISFEEAADLSRSIGRGSVQVVSSAVQVNEIVPDLVENQQHLPEGAVGQPLPAIQRPDVTTPASILTIDNRNPALNGFRCFLALSDRAMAENGDFFLQPHRTAVVWGGQKVLFVFEHHAREFGLYYDIQSDRLVADESGGGEYLTSTLLLGARVFIPIPGVIQPSFIPDAGTTKRLQVRGDVIHSRAPSVESSIAV